MSGSISRLILRSSIPLAVLLLGVLPVHVFAQAPNAKPLSVSYLTEPAISPDRSEIAFVSGGDIWTVPTAGGEARLLVSHPATEARPLYSPDGAQLGFTSTRTGNGDIYILTLSSGEIRRLTFDDGNEQLNAWSHVGRWIYFSSSSHDIGGMNDVFRVSVEGGTPMPVSADRYANEYFSAPAPDGSTAAITANGVNLAGWWRKGHGHLEESEIWLVRFGKSPVYEQVSGGNAKELWPMWSGDGRSLYYISDRGGAENIWVRDENARTRQVTHFKDGRTLWPSISYDGRTIVFERDFQIWTLDPASGKAAPIAIKLRGQAAGPSLEHLRISDQVEEFQLSPDGRKVAFIVRGEVFAAPASSGGEGVRITTTAAREQSLVWSPDSRRLAYFSSRDGAHHLFLYDFGAQRETQLTSENFNDNRARFSPDGKQIAFTRNNQELRILDLETKQERLLARARLGERLLTSSRPLTWSPDGRWIAYSAIDDRHFTNVHVTPVAGGDSKQITFLPNFGAGPLSWSPDGKFILFGTGHRAEDQSVGRLDLVPRLPRYREEQFRNLFREERPGPPAPNPGTPTPPAGPKPVPGPVEINFDGIRQRMNLLPTNVDGGYQRISPDGKWAVIIGAAAGQSNLYLFPLDEPGALRQLTTTPSGKGQAQFSPDGKEIFFLEQGRINIVTVENRQVRPLPVTLELDVDFAIEKMLVFRETCKLVNDALYDPTFNGVDWGAVCVKYQPLFAGAQNPSEMRRLMFMMVGELNVSHLGIFPPASNSALASTVGRIGLNFDRLEYESSGRLRVTEVLPSGPAALTNEIKVGDYLVAVDGSAINARANLDQLLEYKVGRRVTLSVAASADGQGRREVMVQPVNQGAAKALLYSQWVGSRRAYVERVSGGRLGYVHIPAFNLNTLAQFIRDLDTENYEREGVVVDIRSNSGGFTGSFVVDILARRTYLKTAFRGSPPISLRLVNGQRSFEAPTILITNQYTLSDGENFTEGYRALKLGKVVGERTAGADIGGETVTLIDGTGFYFPMVAIADMTGKPMEMNPRPVDVEVVRPIGESYTGRDSQLDAAISELLKQLSGNRARQ